MTVSRCIFSSIFCHQNAAQSSNEIFSLLYFGDPPSHSVFVLYWMWQEQLIGTSVLYHVGALEIHCLYTWLSRSEAEWGWMKRILWKFILSAITSTIDLAKWGSLYLKVKLLVCLPNGKTFSYLFSNRKYSETVNCRWGKNMPPQQSTVRVGKSSN